MRFVVFILLLVHCGCDIQVSIDRTKGEYSVSVNNQVWLRSSRMGLYADDRWFYSNDSSLQLIDANVRQGNDPNLGDWNETQLIFSLNLNGTAVNVTGSIRQWNSYPAISFHLDTSNKELTTNKTLDKGVVRTIFPSFGIEQIDSNDNRGYFTFQGVMSGFSDLHAGVWNASGKVISNAVQGGPVVLFDLKKKGQGDTILISPFSRFMATSMHQTNNILEYGVMGSVITIPANYNHSLVIFYSPNGTNKAIYQWGQFMQRAYNRTNKYRENDITVNYLGFYTDGGAYYYYNTEGSLDYEETMLAVYRKIKLPFHYFQLDSWWYYKGIGQGVSDWQSRPDVFPDGLPSLYRQMEGMPFGAHNRFWASDNVYSDKYSFVFDEVNKLSLPNGNDSFWIDLLGQSAREWGLTMYEQDWLHVQTDKFTPLHTDIHLGRRWLMSMGEGAVKANVTIQYCSPYPRHNLQALEIPYVTQARASDDYTGHLEHNEAQWAIGVTSLLVDALGVAPYKDTFWSTSDEPGASFYTPGSREVLPEREIAMATLSTGPVGPGDGINFTNVERIMKCCRQDGLILKPDRSISMLDVFIADWAQSNGVKQGELYSTETTINDQKFHVIFASDMQRDYSLTPGTLNAQSGLVWSYESPTDVRPFDDSHPLEVSASTCGHDKFCVWYLSPVWEFNDANKTKYALLGETEKWTAVSRQRITEINTAPNKTLTTVSLQGSAGEIVNVSVYHAEMGVVNVKCAISSTTSKAQINILTSRVTCTGIY